MPRNKIVKRTNKRQASNNVMANVQKMENEWMLAPAKLAAQLNKEVNAHKRKENKLKKAADKIQVTLARAETRIKSASQANTPTSKKTLKKAKKIHNEASKAHSDVNKKWKQATQALTSLLDKYAKLIALDKHLSQFEKEWIKSIKALKAKAKSKKDKVVMKPTASLRQAEEQSRVESTPHTLDTVNMDETAEVVS